MVEVLGVAPRVHQIRRAPGSKARGEAGKEKMRNAHRPHPLGTLTGGDESSMNPDVWPN